MKKTLVIFIIFISFLSISIACSDGGDYVGGDGSGGYESTIPVATNYIGNETGDLDGLEIGAYNNIGGKVTPPDSEIFKPINDDIQAALGDGGTTEVTNTTDTTIGGDTKNDKLKELEANGINIDDLKKVCESGKIDSFRQMFKSSGLDDVCELF